MTVCKTSIKKVATLRLKELNQNFIHRKTQYNIQIVHNKEFTGLPEV
jgi:hypothetical protein